MKNDECLIQHKRNREKEIGAYVRYKNYEDYESDDLRKKLKALFNSFYGFTDDNNPFGDPDLSKPFIWHKKISKMRSKGLEPFLDSQSLIIKLKEAKKEIDLLRDCRSKRSKQKGISEETFPNEDYKEKLIEDWKDKDEKFHLAQEKLRTEIRIRQGREKPVDFLHKVLMIWKGLFPIPKDFKEIPEYAKPYLLFDLLNEEELKELHSDLKTHLEVEFQRYTNKSFVCFYIDIASNFKQEHNITQENLKDFIDYWQSLLTLCETQIYPERNVKSIDSKIAEDINQVLDGKDITELDELEVELNKNIEEQYRSEDIQFWNNTLCLLKIQRCRMVLDNLYKEFTEKYKESLLNLDRNHNNDVGLLTEHGNLSPPYYESDEEFRKVALSEHDYLFKISETRKLILAQQLEKRNKRSDTEKKLTVVPQINKNDLINKEKEMDSDEEVDIFLNKLHKKNVPKNKTYTTIKSSSSNNEFPGARVSNLNSIKESRFYLKDDLVHDLNLAKEMKEIETEELGEGESVFNDIVPLAITYPWADKYKPRKPRYINRVTMGYEWNKYNQVHYDYDNPPPKVIQGYKFNIFYPDLFDKTKTPQYFLERSDTPDTCIIRFSAGPPYEDIAFKIVNREWDMSDKADFKNVFDRGILYLYFNFKRYRYKR